jgi:hypothetical protein
MSLNDRSSAERDEPRHQAAASRRPAPRRGDCILTSRDSALLEVWLTRSADCELEIDPVLCSLVRAKLAAARIVLSDDVEPDRARGGSRVFYSVDGGPTMSHLLTHWRHDMPAESILPVTGILGVTLLGMKAGQRLPLVRSDGSWGSVLLQAVLDPATACTAEGAEGNRAPEDMLAPAAGPKIVPFRPAALRRPGGAGGPSGSDDPDPGPAAA